MTETFRRGFDRRRLALPAAVAMAAVVLGAGGSSAFFQNSTLEGTIGTDISGVWLARHHLIPEFRLRYKIEEAGVEGPPAEVGPIGDEHPELNGPKPRGVKVTAIRDQKIANSVGLFVGDYILRVNNTPIDTPSDFADAIADISGGAVALSVRRPGIRHTTARLVKISYAASEGVGDDGTSSVVQEKVRFEVVEAQLPFEDELEETRRKTSLWTATEAQLDALRANWFELPIPERTPFVRGEHRIVAAAAYDGSLLQDANLFDTQFAVISKLQSNPLAGGSGQAVGIYGFQELTPERLAGTYVEATIASAPFPITIEFKGRFDMTRIDDYSNKDVEHRRKLHEVKVPKEDYDDIELAPADDND